MSKKKQRSAPSIPPAPVAVAPTPPAKGSSPYKRFAIYAFLALAAFGAVYGVTKYVNRPVPPPVGNELSVIAPDAGSGPAITPPTSVRVGPPVKYAPPPAGMVLIPAGEFIMGTLGPQAMRNEQPAHRVKLSAFSMDEHEVTVAEFGSFVKAANYKTDAEKFGGVGSGGKGGLRLRRLDLRNGAVDFHQRGRLLRPWGRRAGRPCSNR